MKCQKCDRLNSNFVNHCIYCGTNLFVQKSLKEVAQKIMEDTAGKVDTSPVSPIKPRERREVIVRVGLHHVLDMIGLGLRPKPGYISVPEFPELPEGCTVRGCWSEPFSQTITFAVEHPAFEVVPDGMHAPEWGGGCLKIKWKALQAIPEGFVAIDVGSLEVRDRILFGDHIQELINADGPRIVMPPNSPSLRTAKGREMLLELCRNTIRQIEGTHAQNDE